MTLQYLRTPWGRLLACFSLASSISDVRRTSGHFAVCLSLAALLGACAAPHTLTVDDYRERLPEFEAAALQQPDDLRAQRTLGEAYAQLQRFGEAEAPLRRALALDTGDPKTLYYLGLTMEANGERGEALDLLSRYESVSPDSPFRPLMEGRYVWLRRERARDELQRLLVMDDSLATVGVTDAVAVFPFIYQGRDTRYEMIGRGLGEMLTVDLATTGRLRVIERVRLQALLNELNFVQGDGFDPATTPRLGRLLQSGRVVGGAFDVVGDDLTTDVVLWAWQDEPLPALTEHTGDLARLFQIEKEIVFDLLDHLGITLTREERERIERVPTRDLQAFIAYSRGLLEEDAGLFGTAAQSFQEAVQLDPGFTEAAARGAEAEAVALAGGSLRDALAAARDAESGDDEETDDGRLDARLASLNQSLGAFAVPGQESRPEEVPRAPTTATIPPPPPPPPSGGN